MLYYLPASVASYSQSRSLAISYVHMFTLEDHLAIPAHHKPGISLDKASSAHISSLHSSSFHLALVSLLPLQAALDNDSV